MASKLASAAAPPEAVARVAAVAEDAVRIYSVRTGIGKPCPVCGRGVWSGDDPGDWLDQQVNHLLEEHGWRLLHVGQETTDDRDGNPWQHTVAVLGEPLTAALRRGLFDETS
jgi:hypothetical protein